MSAAKRELMEKIRKAVEEAIDEQPYGKPFKINLNIGATYEKSSWDELDDKSVVHYIVKKEDKQ